MDLPKSHDTPEFREKWQEWIEYRKARKLPKYKTDRTLIDLCRYPVAVAIMAIDDSLRHEWNGLFPEKHGRENVPRDQRLGRDIQRRGRAESAPGKYDDLDSQGILPFIREEKPRDQGEAGDQPLAGSG